MAEECVRLAGNAGLPIVIYRPGMITGHSITGYSNPQDYVNRYLRGIVQMRKAIAEDVYQDMTPVDYVAAAVVKIGLKRAAAGKVFHLVNKKPISYGSIGYSVQSFGYDVELVDFKIWQETLEALQQQVIWSSKLCELFNVAGD